MNDLFNIPTPLAILLASLISAFSSTVWVSYLTHKREKVLLYRKKADELCRTVFEMEVSLENMNNYIIAMNRINKTEYSLSNSMQVTNEIKEINNKFRECCNEVSRYIGYINTSILLYFPEAQSDFTTFHDEIKKMGRNAYIFFSRKLKKDGLNINIYYLFESDFYEQNNIELNDEDYTEALKEIYHVRKDFLQVILELTDRKVNLYNRKLLGNYWKAFIEFVRKNKSKA